MRRHERASSQPSLLVVCTENSVRIDYMTESPNVSGDDRAALLLPDPARDHPCERALSRISVGSVYGLFVLGCRLGYGINQLAV
jgi:hypothetical protein